VKLIVIKEEDRTPKKGQSEVLEDQVSPAQTNKVYIVNFKINNYISKINYV
jgi:hypothetical protein